MNRLAEALRSRVSHYDFVDDLTMWEIEHLANEIAPVLSKLIDERIEDRIDRAGSRVFDRE